MLNLKSYTPATPATFHNTLQLTTYGTNNVPELLLKFDAIDSYTYSEHVTLLRQMIAPLGADLSKFYVSYDLNGDGGLTGVTDQFTVRVRRIDSFDDLVDFLRVYSIFESTMQDEQAMAILLFDELYSATQDGVLWNKCVLDSSDPIIDLSPTYPDDMSMSFAEVTDPTSPVWNSLSDYVSNFGEYIRIMSKLRSNLIPYSIHNIGWVDYTYTAGNPFTVNLRGVTTADRLKDALAIYQLCSGSFCNLLELAVGACYLIGENIP